jgi:acetyl-CoA hydrolase
MTSEVLVRATHRSAENVPFHALLRPGDRISFGQACSEPVSLVRALLQQGQTLHASLGRLKVFVAGSYSRSIRPEHAAWFEFFSYGAFGDAAALVRSGLLELYPIHYSALPSLLANECRPDVVLLQLSAPDASGRHSLGVASDFQLATARRARVVIAEVNAQVPFSPHALLPEDVRIDHVVETDRPLVEGPPASVDPTASRIAEQVAGIIPNGATLQMGIGALMDAICHALRSHRDLGVHTGVMTDGMADLMQCGAVTNAQKGSHVGMTVAGSLLGSRRLFEFANHNAQICLVENAISHGADSLARQRRFCSINSAVEVDLTGQINAEVGGARYVGAVGGQGDFVRAANRSEGGIPIIALPSGARGGQVSRIVARLSGPVTTARSDVDCVATEWGVARLRGLSLRQRASAMAAIAHPDHRDSLVRAAEAVAA